MTAEKRTIKKPIHGDPFHPQRVTGYLKIAKDDGQGIPTTIIVDGKEVLLSASKPLPKPVKDDKIHVYGQDD